MSTTTPTPPQVSPSPVSPPQAQSYSPGAPPVSYEARYTLPKKPLSQRINSRMLIFAAVVLIPIGWLTYVFVHETFTGGITRHGNFAEVDLKAMSNFDMDQNSATRDDIPKRWRDLDGTRVMFTGQMWSPQQAGNGYLGYFQTVYSKTKCCFSGPPLAQHFVDCNVKPGVEAEYYGDDFVHVYGTLHVYIRKEAGVIKSIYHVDVDKVEPLS